MGEAGLEVKGRRWHILQTPHADAAAEHQKRRLAAEGYLGMRLGARGANEMALVRLPRRENQCSETPTHDGDADVTDRRTHTRTPVAATRGVYRGLRRGAPQAKNMLSSDTAPFLQRTPRHDTRHVRRSLNMEPTFFFKSS